MELGSKGYKNYAKLNNINIKNAISLNDIIIRIAKHLYDN